MEFNLEKIPEVKNFLQKFELQSQKILLERMEEKMKKEIQFLVPGIAVRVMEDLVKKGEVDARNQAEQELQKKGWDLDDASSPKIAWDSETQRCYYYFPTTKETFWNAPEKTGTVPPPPPCPLLKAVVVVPDAKPKNDLSKGAKAMSPRDAVKKWNKMYMKKTEEKESREGKIVYYRKKPKGILYGPVKIIKDTKSTWLKAEQNGKVINIRIGWIAKPKKSPATPVVSETPAIEALLSLGNSAGPV